MSHMFREAWKYDRPVVILMIALGALGIGCYAAVGIWLVIR